MLSLDSVSSLSLDENSSMAWPGQGGSRKASMSQRRRGVRTEIHPQRQSTPRRRLFEARMADQVFTNNSGNSCGGGGSTSSSSSSTGSLSGRSGSVVISNNASPIISPHIQEEVALALTPRLARSSSHMGFVASASSSSLLSSNTMISHSYRGTSARDRSFRYMNVRARQGDLRETRSARSLSRETLECIAATAREVAAESLFTGARNVVAAFALSNSQSAVDLPTYISPQFGKMDSVREDAEEENE